MNTIFPPAVAHPCAAVHNKIQAAAGKLVQHDGRLGDLGRPSLSLHMHACGQQRPLQRLQHRLCTAEQQPEHLRRRCRIAAALPGTRSMVLVLHVGQHALGLHLLWLAQ